VKKLLSAVDVLDVLGMVGLVSLGAGLWIVAMPLALIVVGAILTAVYLWPALLAAWREGGQRE